MKGAYCFSSLEECLKRLVVAKETLDALEERIKDLELLPSLLARFDKDAWFCIFKRLKQPRDILVCSRVCRIWRESIEKYIDCLPCKSPMFSELYGALKTEWPDVPLYIRTIRDRTKLYFLLMPLSQHHWLVLLRQITKMQSLTFLNSNRTIVVKHTDETVNIDLNIEVTLNCMCSFQRLEFLPKQVDPRAITQLTLVGTFRGKTARYGVQFVHDAPKKPE